VWYDGIFSYQKNILVSFGIENVNMFYGHLEYFKVIWNIVGLFGIIYGNLVKFCGQLVHIFFPYGLCNPEKSSNPGSLTCLSVSAMEVSRGMHQLISRCF
jgi:hypothetical protein